MNCEFESELATDPVFHSAIKPKTPNFECLFETTKDQRKSVGVLHRTLTRRGLVVERRTTINLTFNAIGWLYLAHSMSSSLFWWWECRLSGFCDCVYMNWAGCRWQNLHWPAVEKIEFYTYSQFGCLWV